MHAQMPDDFDEILQAKAQLTKYLKGKCYSGHNQKLFSKYFAKLFLILKVVAKVSKIQRTISRASIFVRLNNLLGCSCDCNQF